MRWREAAPPPSALSRVSALLHHSSAPVAVYISSLIRARGGGDHAHQRRAGCRNGTPCGIAGEIVAGCLRARKRRVTRTTCQQVPVQKTFSTIGWRQRMASGEHVKGAKLLMVTAVGRRWHGNGKDAPCERL